MGISVLCDNILMETNNSLALLPTLLLPWYQKNARVLPWRIDQAPYRVWISEIMLQQTRVEAVIPYYERFLACLPDISSLAMVDEDTLLKLWEGLGYYNRARNLQKAARIIMEEYQGVFPSQPEAILSLPGIGEYTAGAIASICFHQPMPAVDGNVLRVIARYQKQELMDKNKQKQAIIDALGAIYPHEQPGAFTQSLMELGATVCLPNGTPRCALCPLQNHCLAHQCHEEADYPRKVEKKARRNEQYTVLLLRYQQCYAVKKREETGLLAGMYEFIPLAGNKTESEIACWCKQHQLTVSSYQPLAMMKHIFTHVEWMMYPWLVECTELPEGYEWYDPKDAQTTISLPTAFKKLLKQL